MIEKKDTCLRVKGIALSSHSINMGKKRTNKISLNNDNVKRLEMDHVKISEKDKNELTANQKMHLDSSYDSSSDDSDNAVNKNVQVKDKMANTKKSVSSKTKMADNEVMEKTNELYKYTDKGPYYVISECKNIDEFHLCELLMKFKAKDIIDVNKITKDKVRIHTKTFTAANTIIKLSTFSAFDKYKFYVPNNFVFTDGIVRDIPLYYDETQLKDMIDCKVPIVNITRLTFWNHTLKIAQPSNSIKITFRSSTIPDNVSIMWLLRKVDLFVPKPLFCQQCLSYGHFKKYCPTDKDLFLCRVCAKPIHNEDIVCKKTCKHCKTENNHLTADRNCPAFKYQCDIKKIQQNPTPAASSLTYKKSYADIVSSAQQPAGTLGLNQPIKTTTPTTMTNSNGNTDNSKEKSLIIAITKLMENTTRLNSPGNNDELLINIGQEITNFWKVPAPSQPSTSNGTN